jgi:hypothetical protein
MKNLLYCVLLCTIAFSACNKSEDVPSYIYIKPFTLSTNAASEGVNTSKITEAWVYANGNPLGAYKIPGEVPIPATGNVELTIYAGVRNNGGSATPAIYFHYKRFDITMDLKAGKLDTISPSTSYEKDLTFAWLEDFETKNSLNYDADTDPLNNFQTTKQDVKYGAICGLFQVNDSSQTVSVTTKDALKGIPSNQRVYLEVDYKGTANFQVQLVGNTATTSKPLEVATFRGRDDWNKAYVNFRFKDYNPTEYLSYNFIFAADIPRDDNGKPTMNAAELRIDNIKLIYPK